RRPQRRIEAHIGKLAGIALVGVQPIAHIAFLGQTWQLDDANSLRRAMQRRCGLERLLAACFVVVFEDEHIASRKRGKAIVRPLAACDSGCAVVERRNAICIFLALADKHAGVRVFQKLLPAIWHAARVTKAPDPAALAARSTLTKVLRFEPHDLVEQLSVLVSVVVSRDDATFSGFALDRLYGSREHGIDLGGTGATATI